MRQRLSAGRVEGEGRVLGSDEMLLDSKRWLSLSSNGPLTVISEGDHVLLDLKSRWRQLKTFVD